MPGALPHGSCSGVSMSAGEGWQNHGQQNHFLEVCRAAARVVNMGGSTFALLAPCSLRPPGHLRCASYAKPVASVGLTHFSAAQAAFEGSMAVSVVQA